MDGAPVFDEVAWLRVAETAARVEAARAELDEARVRIEKATPAGWPWRVSKRGNLVTRRGDPVMLPLGDRRARRWQAACALRAVTSEIWHADLRLQDAEKHWSNVRPAEPGLLYGYPVPDASRVTAQQFADAINAQPDFSAYATAVPTDTGVVFTFHDVPRPETWAIECVPY
mgnify:FL=1